ncbi:hypothetical protein [Psychrobacter sp. DAB_AL32B]|uniref:hypothetical protein n=1 Tax=Psychrobacter sp. DAB_AL32B TaxID=1028414 RepID=UPI000B7C5E1B|nr:hypothetical protein [Psychrobacter sp. DAB_AL32B]OXL24604.1 hypothetical protein CAN34_05480 [Psychrobacter sp. DAB_AL32B]
MSILANKIEDKGRGFILVSEVLELISKVTNNDLNIVKDSLLSDDIQVSIPVYHKTNIHEFDVPDANRPEGYFNSTYKALTETLTGNEYFYIDDLEDFKPLRRLDIFAYQRGYHYIAKQTVGKFKSGKSLGKFKSSKSLGKFRSGEYVTGLSLTRAIFLLKEGAIEKRTIEQHKQDMSLQGDSILPSLIVDEYDTNDDIDQQNKNCEDEYLTVYRTIELIKERTGLYYDLTKLRDVARKKEVIPCFYFSGYVGSSVGKRTGRLYTEFVTGYFTYGGLKDEIDKPGRYIELPSSKVKNDLMIYRVLEKQTAEYTDYDEEICLFTSKPRGSYDADKLELTYIDNGEIRFSKSAIDRYLDSTTKVSSVSLEDQKAADSQATIDKITIEKAEMQSELIKVRAQLEEAVQSQASMPVHPDSIKIPHQAFPTIDKVMYAMAKLTKLDNSNPYGQNRSSLNEAILRTLSENGFKLEYEAVGKWLTRINDVKSLTSEPVTTPEKLKAAAELKSNV